MALMPSMLPKGKLCDHILKASNHGDVVMADFNPEKLHVRFDSVLQEKVDFLPRCYTLTHSDRTGELFLSIAPSYDREQISGWYTRLMRDEVLAEWQMDHLPELHLHCHISGGFVLGSAQWRDEIFRQHLPLVLYALCYGDRNFLLANPAFLDADILVHFHAKQTALDRLEKWGYVKDFLT